MSHATISPSLRDIITNLTAPSGLPGWCDTSKALHLAQLVLTHRPQLAIELGVFGGRSFVPLALAVQHNAHQQTPIHPGPLAIGIDPWSNSAAIEGMDPHDADDVKNIAYWSEVPMAAVHRRCADVMEGHKLWDVATLIQGRAEKLAHLFGPNSVDFLHIDSNHHHALAEVHTWLPRCVPGAMVVFDDSNWPQTQTAIAVLDEMCELVEDRSTYRVYRKKQL